MTLHPQAEAKLAELRKVLRINTKGRLATMLFVSRVARSEGLPLDPTSLRTEKRGQVKGLSKARVQEILASYTITRTLASEAGRTSRGSLGNMEEYVALLNELHEAGQANMEAIEAWWVDRIVELWASQPLKLRLDASKSLMAVIRDLLGEVEKRQQEDEGATYVGTVLQHLVGAKLELALGVKLERHGASVADTPTGREGDYVIDRVAIHVTTAPGQALMEKCRVNLEAGFYPIVVTLQGRLDAAAQNADMIGLGDRIEVFSAEQFLAANLHELGGFRAERRRTSVEELLERYNEIVEQCETDPSLKIELGG